MDLALARKILQQLEREVDINSKDRNIGIVSYSLDSKLEVRWIMRNPKFRQTFFERDIKGNIVNLKNSNDFSLYTETNHIYRDSKLGGEIIIKGIGQHNYINRNQQLLELNVESFSVYNYKDNIETDAINGYMYSNKREPFYFDSLRKHYNNLNLIIYSKPKQIESNKMLDIEQFKKELEDKENEYIFNRILIQTYVSHELALRDQPILDKYQEQLKRSKIFNGGLIINGGPGTGKTTSLIQRVVYLTSNTILEEIDLSKEKQEILFN
ncbi:MAG: hypothetical protein ACK4IX_18600, partial [Candidatus Sericytochromatia bacterium]